MEPNELSVKQSFNMRGNKDCDELILAELEDGRIYFRVGHCCVSSIRLFLPVEILTAIFDHAFGGNRGLREYFQVHINWPDDFKEQLLAQIEEPDLSEGPISPTVWPNHWRQESRIEELKEALEDAAEELQELKAPQETLTTIDQILHPDLWAYCEGCSSPLELADKDSWQDAYDKADESKQYPYYYCLDCWDEITAEPPISWV